MSAASGQSRTDDRRFMKSMFDFADFDRYLASQLRPEFRWSV